MIHIFHVNNFHLDISTKKNSLRPYASENWIIIDSGNGLTPLRRQAIAWTNAELLSIKPSWTNFGQILIEIQIFSFKKMH